MIEMTLFSRHRMQNSSPGGLRPSRLPLGLQAPHNTVFQPWMGKKLFFSFKPPRLGTEPRTLAWKAAVLTSTLGPPPITTNDTDRRVYKPSDKANKCAL